MADNRSPEAATAQPDTPDVRPDASNPPFSVSNALYTNDDAPPEGGVASEATGALQEAAATQPRNQDGPAAPTNEPSEATAILHKDAASQWRIQDKPAAPAHRRSISSTSDFAYPPTAGTRNVPVQHGDGLHSRDNASESPERDLYTLTRTATNESFDSSGLTAVNTNESFDSAGLTVVNTTTRNSSGSGEGGASPLNSIEAMAALTTDWSATIDIFGGSELWGKAVIVTEAVQDQARQSNGDFQARAGHASVDHTRAQAEVAPGAIWKLWLGDKVRAWKPHLSNEARA